MKKNKVKTNSGFMALMSVVIISAILLLIATDLSLNGFYVRSNILDAELKEKSVDLAEACADVAILKLSQDSTYNPTNEIVTIGSDTCTIESITATSEKTISIKADYNNYVTHLKIVVDSSDASVISWREI